MYKKVIIDSCTIIFLSKICSLDILFLLFPGEITTIKKVKDEIEKGFIPVDELIEINKFLNKIEIVDTNKTFISSSTLSRTDNELITYAVNNNFDIMITDDNLLRRVSQHEKIKTIGTLGLLVQCAIKKIYLPDVIRGFIDDLIKKHNLRISVELYSDIISSLDEMKNSGGNKEK